MSSVPPSNKKARTESNAGACTDDTYSPAFFLDSCPKEILDNVLRFFSRLPEANDWFPHIPLESIVELYVVWRLVELRRGIMRI